MSFVTNVAGNLGNPTVGLAWMQYPTELDEVFHKRTKIDLMIDLPDMSAISRYYTEYAPAFSDVGLIVLEKIVISDEDFIKEVEASTGGKLIGLCHNHDGYCDYVLFIDGEAIHLEGSGSESTGDICVECDDGRAVYINSFYIQNSKQLMSASFLRKKNRLMTPSILAKIAKSFALYHGQIVSSTVCKPILRSKHLGDHGNDIVSPSEE